MAQDRICDQQFMGYTFRIKLKMRNYLYLKNYCTKIFVVGAGNFWYEKNVVGDDHSTLYKVYSYSLFMIYGFMTLLEILAAVIGDFPDDEKSDSIAFALSHTIVMIKIFSVVLNKNLVKNLVQDLVKVCELHEEESLMVEKYKIMSIIVMAYFSIVYGSAACFVFEGVRKLNDGVHFVTVVTYVPAFEDNSQSAVAIRITNTIVLFIMLLTMVYVDCFALITLVIFKYKFITLRYYFEKLRTDFEMLLETSNRRSAIEKLERGLIEGIVMHKELLRISKEIDKAFGTVLVLQLCQSSGSVVSLLLQIALSDQLTIVARMKIIFFAIGLFFLLGLFLCNAGDITCEASLLSESFFYCGWHLCPSQYPNQTRRKRVGRLVLLACAQAQRPIVMKACKMLELTRATFLLVVRVTYSVFALFYAQNQ